MRARSGTVAAVCVSPRKGIAKRPVAVGLLEADRGVRGDAHAGPGHRQVSVLTAEHVATLRSPDLDLAPGAFGENLLLTGIDLDGAGIGSRLEVGRAEIEITQIGKTCHSRCAIWAATGDCIMPRTGVFGVVTRTGEVRAGDPARIATLVHRDVVQLAVLTVSDRCFRGEAQDTAGPAAAALAGSALDAHVAWTGTVADDRAAIAAHLDDLAGRAIDLVLTVGGTGLAARDVTPEATREMIDREIPGLAEAMRAASAASTPNAWLSRAVCGIRGRTLIVNLPGSYAGARENLQAVLPALPHAIALVRGDTAHPVADAGRAPNPDAPSGVCP